MRYMAQRSPGTHTRWEHLYRLRRRARLSVAQLADQVGCHRTTIHAVETGSRRPSSDLIDALADHFGENSLDFELTLPPRITSRNQSPRREPVGVAS
jgi:DNA-binding XRE family transcriptional regulator